MYIMKIRSNGILFERNNVDYIDMGYITKTTKKKAPKL